MTTIYDHIKLEAGLIQKLPGRSTIMNTKITVEYTGNMSGLVEFMEATFKDPDALTLNVTVNQANQVTQGNKTPMEHLVEKCASQGTGLVPNARENLLQAMPRVLQAGQAGQKIQAIKEVRAATGCGLKEAKDMVEGPIQNYIDRGGV